MAATAQSKSLPPLRVRYPRRMKLRKTYTVKVTWSGRPPRLGEDAPDIKVRLVMGGAQVVPSERSMDPNKPGEPGIFYITPLAKGWLRGERLEVIAEGEKIQEIALPAKVVSQRKTWFLLLLAIVLPWFLVSFVQQDRIGKRVNDPWISQIEKPTPLGWLKEKLQEDASKTADDDKDQEKDDQKKKRSRSLVADLFSIARVNYNVVWRLAESDKIKIKNATQELRDDWGNPSGAGAGGGGKQKAPDQNNVKKKKRPFPVPAVYQQLYLPFYSFVGFCFLALISLWWHKQRWKSRLGKPIRLAITD